MIDLGTGDGRAVIDRARSEPGALVIGIDASAAAMAEMSRRAARNHARGGLANAVFVVAAAERPPIELVGVADEMTITFPWGSLLRGALACEDAAQASAGIAALVKDGGTIRALVSITERDGIGVPPLEASAADALAARWSARGLCLETCRPATAEDLTASRSSWARRLRAGQGRPAWLLELRRPDRTHRCRLDRPDVETG